MLRLAAILFCFLPLLAQEQPPSKTETDKAALASVSGMVVRADTGEPLKKAKIYLGSNESETNYEERTDAEGRFQISNVQPGRYGVWAVAQGYVGSSYGVKSSRRRVPMMVLEKGQRVQDLLFRLQRTAAITGKIVDEEGTPVQDATVTVNVYQGRGEKRRLSPRQSVQTNDLGEYRIYGLEAGKYYLRATPTRDYSAVWGALRAPEKRTRKSEQTENSAYPSLFYPAALDVSQATRLELKPGDETRADFTFAPVQAFSVRGTVVGTLPKSTDPVVVVLLPKGERGEGQQAARVRSDGSYEIPDVLPGSYRLSVSGAGDYFNPSLQTTMRTVEVTNSDVNGIDLAVPTTTKVELRGRLSVEGEATASLDRFGLHLMPADDDDNEKRYGIRRAQVNSDGTFAFQQVSPGTYAVGMSGGYRPGRGQYVKSVRFGTREVVETGFTVTEGTQPRLDVVLSSATGRIEGVVLDDKEQPVGGIDVVAIPRGGQHLRRFGFRVSGTDKNGGFVLTHLRPGQYRLYAFDRGDYSDYRDDDFLSEHESASATADAQVGNTVKVKLKLISLEEEDRTADLE